MTFSLGLKRSAPHKLARRVPLELHPAVRANLASTLPTNFDLVEWQPILLDQNATGSCTRGSTSSAYYTAFNAAGRPLGYIPSQRDGYRNTRAYERAMTTVPGQALAPLQDSGAELADVFHCDATIGIRPMIVPTTPDGAAYDVWPDIVNNEPNLADMEVDAQQVVTGPYSIDPTAANASDIVAAAIVARMPVEMAFFCDAAFQQLSPGQIAGVPNTADSSGGGHAVYLSGYQTENGKRVFTLTNSWGQWCSGGRCLVSEDWLHAAWESWPIALVLEVQ